MASTFSDYHTTFCTPRVGCELTDIYIQYSQLEPRLKLAEMNTVKNHLKCQATSSGGGGGGAPKKKTGRRLSFTSTASLYTCNTAEAPKQVATRDTNFKPRQSLKIAAFYETHLADFIHRVVFGMPWDEEVCGTHIGFTTTLLSFNQGELTKKQVQADLRKMYARVLDGKMFTLNFRKSDHISPTIPEQKCDPFTNEWAFTGKKIPIYPIIRRFLIRCVRDEEFAAIAIQRAWYRKVAIDKVKVLRAAAAAAMAQSPPTPPSSWENIILDNVLNEMDAHKKNYLYDCYTTGANDKQASTLTGGSKKVARCAECTRPVDNNGVCSRCHSSSGGGGGNKRGGGGNKRGGGGNKRGGGGNKRGGGGNKRGGGGNKRGGGGNKRGGGGNKRGGGGNKRAFGLIWAGEPREGADEQEGLFKLNM